MSDLFLVFSVNIETKKRQYLRDIFGDNRLFCEAEAIRECAAYNDLLTSNGRKARVKYNYEKAEIAEKISA